MFPQSSAKPEGRTGTPGAGLVLSLERSFYNPGFGTELRARGDVERAGSQRNASPAARQLSQSLPILTLSFLLCKTGYEPPWATFSLRERD